MKKKVRKNVSKKQGMKKEVCCEPKMDCDTKMNCNTGGCAYFLGAIGAAVYYISTATGFWNGVLGLLKALVWPVFLVFELLSFLGA